MSNKIIIGEANYGEKFKIVDNNKYEVYLDTHLLSLESHTEEFVVSKKSDPLVVSYAKGTKCINIIETKNGIQIPRGVCIKVTDYLKSQTYGTKYAFFPDMFFVKADFKDIDGVVKNITKRDETFFLVKIDREKKNSSDKLESKLDRDIVFTYKGDNCCFIDNLVLGDSLAILKSEGSPRFPQLIHYFETDGIDVAPQPLVVSKNRVIIRTIGRDRVVHHLALDEKFDMIHISEVLDINLMSTEGVDKLEEMIAADHLECITFKA